jgi:hypothetical protein
MKLEHIFEVGTPVDVLYHVTLTKHIPSILKNGITHFNPSNWIKAGSKERYGEGDIYAFESEQDAVRWAAKMDWDLHKKMGSGNVSVVQFQADRKNWKEDVADPIGQAGATGAWLKSVVVVKPVDIKGHYPVTVERIKPLAR